MSSIPATDKNSSSSRDLVEVVKSAHGRKKAKYAGGTFKLHSRHGTRHYWRCDLRPSRWRPGYRWDPDWEGVGRVRSVLRVCKSRLTTDLYGDQHFVYAYHTHNEKLHRLAVWWKRRAEARNMHQPRRLIEDFWYVLESREGPLQTWRCEFTECAARCQSHHDGLIVNWLSLHLEDVHARTGHPFTKKQHWRNVLILRRLHEQRQPLRDDAEGQPSSPASAAANVVSDVATFSSGRKSHRLPAMLVQVTGAPPRDGALSSNASSDSGGGNQHSLPQNVSKAAAAIHGGGHSDVPCQKHADEGKAEHKRDNASLDIEFDCKEAAGENTRLTKDCFPDHHCDTNKEGSPVNVDHECSSAAEATLWCPYKGATSLLHDQYYGANSRIHTLCEDVLQMMCDVGDNRERDLRASILVHMYRLLEAETSLVKEKCRVEVMRGKVLEQQTRGHRSAKCGCSAGQLPPESAR